jgi:hypothetical protein
MSGGEIKVPQGVRDNRFKIGWRMAAGQWTDDRRLHIVARGITFWPEGHMASATSVKLDDDMKERVRHLAEVRKRTSHWIMREAIQHLLFASCDLRHDLELVHLQFDVVAETPRSFGHVIENLWMIQASRRNRPVRHRIFASLVQGQGDIASSGHGRAIAQAVDRVICRVEVATPGPGDCARTGGNGCRCARARGPVRGQVEERQVALDPENAHDGRLVTQVDDAPLLEYLTKRGDEGVGVCLNGVEDATVPDLGHISGAGQMMIETGAHWPEIAELPEARRMRGGLEPHAQELRASWQYMDRRQNCRKRGNAGRRGQDFGHQGGRTLVRIPR